MAARTGKDFLDRLADSRPTVHIQGETLTGGIQHHPAFRNVVRTYAELYDLQHSAEHKDVLTHPSPTSGEPVATSFLAPTAPDELVKRREAFTVWAEYSNGMLGRTGDYLNSGLMAMATAADWFAEADPAFGDNIRRYYEKVREEDLLLSHTLIPPQVNRAVAGPRQAGGSVTARIVREDDNGVVIRGARMLATIAPFADELLVLPSTLLRGAPEDRPHSYALAVPMDAEGLRCIAREPLDHGLPRHDHPLASRFDEPDCVVVFDDVHVPYERCFLLGDVDRCNGLFARTSAVVHMSHQVVTRTVAKTEYVLGLVSLLTEAIGIEGYQHVQDDVAEVITTLEMLRAFLRAAEADAAVNEFGVLTPAWAPLNAARNLYPKLYQRFPQILRKLGAAGLMATPTGFDVIGPAAADIDVYLQSATLTGAERVKLFRLLWDTCGSAFSGRQALYEYYFFGDPVRMAGAYVASYDREPYKARVRAFLDGYGANAATDVRAGRGPA
ncbi:4-hydroxyphenylacetate 3-monooxygenase, oxygenase component [Streptomyces sp. C36]|uniref:4-hydroxyphenylacetate 3-monooxygenase, oxygenase component n=1 Tax=Streptomyces sp. C36 TaxID=3237122 RepID=UPI0034C6A5F2